MTRPRIIPYLAVVSLIFVAITLLPAALAGCPEGVHCRVCSGTADCNMIPTFPRFTIGGTTSNNLADFDIFRCDTITTSPLNHPVHSGCKNPRVEFKNLGSMSDSRELKNYVFSLSLYAAFTLLLALGVLIAGISFGICRYACCCCCFKSYCCSRTPTAKYGTSTMLYRPLAEGEERAIMPTVGSSVNYDGEVGPSIEKPENGMHEGVSEGANPEAPVSSNQADAPRDEPVHRDFVFEDPSTSCCGKCCTCCPCLGMTRNPNTFRLEYSNKSKWITRGYVGVFLACLLSFILVAIFKGNDKVPETAEYTANDASTDALKIFNSLSDRTIDLSMELFGTSFKQTVNKLTVDINTDILPLEDLRTKVTCVANGIIEAEPDFALLGTKLDDLNTAFGNIGSGIPQALTDLQTQLNTVETKLGELDSQMTTSSTALSATSAVATTIQNREADVGNQETALVNAATALETSVQNWIDNLSSLPTDYSVANDLQVYLTDVQTVSTSALQTLRNNLDAMLTTLTTLSSEVGTSYDTDFANYQTNALALTNPSSGTLKQSQDDIDGVLLVLTTQRSDINDKITAVNSAVSAIDASSLNTALSNANNALTTTVQDESFFNALVGELDRVQNLNTAVGCVDGLDVMLGDFKSKAMTFDALDNLNLQDIKTQLNDAVTQVEDLRVQARTAFDDVKSQATSVDLAGLTSGIDSAISGLKSNLNDNTDFSPAFMDAGITSLTQARDDVAERLTHRTADALTNDESSVLVPSAQSMLTSTLSQLTSVISSIDDNLSNAGVCSDDASACTVDTDCGSNICVHNQGDYPPADGSSLQNSLTKLSAVFTSTKLSDLKTKMTTTKERGSLNAQTRVQIARVQVAAVSSVSFSTISSAISGARSAVSGAALDLDQRATEMQDMLNSIGDAAVGELRDNLDTLATDFNNLDGDIRTQLTETRQTVNTFIDFVNVKLPEYLDRLETSVLKTTLKNDGSLALAQLVTGVVDEATEYLATEQTQIQITATNTQAKANRYEKEFRTLVDQTHRTMGLLHWGMVIMLGEEKVMSPGDPRARTGRIYTDANGHRYADGVNCYLRSCITNEIEYVWRKAELRAAHSEVMWLLNGSKEDSSLPNLSLTVEQLAMLPLIFPALVFVFGLLTLVIVCRNSVAKWFQSFFGSMAVGCMFCQMPFILLILAAFFPFAIFMGDACYSSEAVIVTQYLPKMDHCNQLFQGTTDPVTGMCAAEFGPVKVSFDSYALARGVLGTCDTAAQAAFASLHQSIQDELTDLPDTVYNDYILSTNQIQPTLNGILDNTKSFWRTVLVAYGDDVNNILTCESFSNAYQGFKATPCCGLTEGIWWIAASWYMIAWSMLFCGIPSLLLARKRLPYEPWGPVYEENELELAKAKGNNDGSIELAELGHDKNYADDPKKQQINQDPDDAEIPPTPTHQAHVAIDVPAMPVAMPPVANQPAGPIVVSLVVPPPMYPQPGPPLEPLGQPSQPPPTGFVKIHQPPRPLLAPRIPDMGAHIRHPSAGNAYSPMYPTGTLPPLRTEPIQVAPASPQPPTPQ